MFAVRYLRNSIKVNLKIIFGIGSRKILDEDTKLRPHYKSDFLTHSKSKSELYINLAENT